MCDVQTLAMSSFSHSSSLALCQKNPHGDRDRDRASAIQALLGGATHAELLFVLDFLQPSPIYRLRSLNARHPPGSKERSIFTEYLRRVWIENKSIIEEMARLAEAHELKKAQWLAVFSCFDHNPRAVYQTALDLQRDVAAYGVVRRQMFGRCIRVIVDCIGGFLGGNAYVRLV